MRLGFIGLPTGLAVAGLRPFLDPKCRGLKELDKVRFIKVGPISSVHSLEGRRVNLIPVLRWRGSSFSWTGAVVPESFRGDIM